MNRPFAHHAAHFVPACIIGVIVGAAVSAATVGFLRDTDDAGATNVYSPVWLLNPLGGCADWKDDTDFWPGSSTVRFQDYWSGKPVFWNYPPSNGCWHSDAGAWKPAIDLPSATNTEVKYKHYIGGPSQWASTFFRAASGCGGIAVDVYTPNGFLAGVAYYWHITQAGGVVDTWGTTATETFPETLAERVIGYVAAPGSDGCTSTGAHLYLGVEQGGYAQPNKDGAVTWGPMIFAWD